MQPTKYFADREKFSGPNWFDFKIRVILIIAKREGILIREKNPKKLTG